jgi:hypothetical protein
MERELKSFREERLHHQAKASYGRVGWSLGYDIKVLVAAPFWKIFDHALSHAVREHHQTYDRLAW